MYTRYNIINKKRSLKEASKRFQRSRFHRKHFKESQQYTDEMLETVYGLVEPLQTVLSLSDIYDRYGNWTIEDFLGNELELPEAVIFDYIEMYDPNIDHPEEIVNSTDPTTLKQFLLDQGLITRG